MTVLQPCLSEAIKKRFTEHALRAKVASDAESLERARELLAHATAESRSESIAGDLNASNRQNKYLQSGSRGFIRLKFPAYFPFFSEKPE